MHKLQLLRGRGKQASVFLWGLSGIISWYNYSFNVKQCNLGTSFFRIANTEIFSTFFITKYVALNIKQQDQLRQEEKAGTLFNPRACEGSCFSCSAFSTVMLRGEGGLCRVSQTILWLFQQPGLSPAKEGDLLPSAQVNCFYGEGRAGVQVWLGHGYRVELSSTTGFSVCYQAGTRSLWVCNCTPKPGVVCAKGWRQKAKIESRGKDETPSLQIIVVFIICPS